MEFDATKLAQRFQVDWNVERTPFPPSATSTEVPAPPALEPSLPSANADRAFAELLDAAFDACRLKNFALARTLYERAAELHPDDRRVQYNLRRLAGRAA